ncbi:short-chain dehydrogenase [Alkalilimnicola ehrlichii]|uniref:Short-chain dehydrogenase n=2 Tax=Alkalilimnicola ehrlichii TaxID=351052 RepID=A0A3E0WVY5_9GAMM|nr:short-chain dehydrogenase [Alkalilimnicola ehrlichii]RFA36559.1 short-chain dehydrogenase [Alkalilimnicola ehrlichii]
MTQSPPPLLAYPFRPFFLLTGVYAAVSIVAWLGFLYGGWPLPLGGHAVYWHAHEMLFGFIAAAIAGFLLTAMTNWTGAPPLKGGGLLALLLLWLAGRVAMWLTGYLPSALVAVVDISFLLAVALYAGTVLRRYGNRRNYLLVAVLLLFAVANTLMHLQFMGWAMSAVLGQTLAFNLITLLMVIIAGRITPAFTANWLRMQGQDPAQVHRSERLDRWVLIVTALMIPADLIIAYAWVGGLVALAAALVNGVRLWQWSGWLSRREPLLWILHLGYLWLVVALVLKGLTPFLNWPASIWLHAMGVGAAGVLILGVMTRVAVGHTGRALHLVRWGVLIYLAVNIAAGLRLLAATDLLDYQLGLSLSGGAWSLAFLLFVVLYWPILSRPRADGRPG